VKARCLLVILAVACSPLRLPAVGPTGTVTVGSKAFPESLILGELVAQLVRASGVEARHRETRGLGGTRVLWNALVKGDIDVYPEYTGTISEEILAGQGVRGEAAIRQALEKHGIRMSRPLGFNNTYAIGMKEEVAEKLGVRKVSELRQHPDLRFGFSNEFLKRADGWPSLKAHYRLPQTDVRGMEHTLAYVALDHGDIQAMELYSTEGKIRQYGVRVLEDDLHHFPDYQAVLLYRDDLRQRAPDAVEAMLRLQGGISEKDMMEMNARVEQQKASEERVAGDFLARTFDIRIDAREESALERVARYTRQHLLLVAVSLAAAILAAVPLGIWAARRPRLGQSVLTIAGLVQTVPALALLVLLMSLPWLGLGFATAAVAMFLYSLLPIMRNTYTGLHDIPASIRESAEALGLPPGARLRLIELPMASRSILAGIKTAAVINVGTATLGGFIGAGGYGQPIFTGLTLMNVPMILEGAVPAALLALLVQGLFELAERRLVPRGLRLTGEV
jgi:osmoprotectant transport system permease protein